ncbi:glycosyl hydrolase family 65 protein [Lentzea sp. NBRC 105346]|uniref:MGH1-like glycoside hydrolase domain-containing protein n=1 Tax=Lentzea sp. NBRC 105346 TaxID=3032205 RepID=UPI002554FF63|nr:glycosyl hydrolase family 65 protein [Lentzea sp. NBRC 105346]
MWPRRMFLAMAGTGLALAELGMAPAGAVRRSYRAGGALPVLELNQPEVARAYESALTNVVGINTVYADPATYDRAGLLRYPPGTFVRAGSGYPEPQRWTRDCAVNAWNAASLLNPLVGGNTLMAVVDDRIVQQDNQWWDQVVWIIAACHHYLVTGEFLGEAHEISVHTLAAREANFNASRGLFEGPSFMNDGIAGYPSPPWRPGVRSSFVLDYPGADRLMCLSTNCLYHGAFLAVAAMAEALGRPADGFRRRAAELRRAINQNLWRGNTYGYFVTPDGRVDPTQESAGLAFAIMLGVASAEQTRQILDGAHWEPRGIPTSRPHFPRFGDDRPGRHNVSVWPVVHSMFGHAAALGGRTDLFGRAVTDLARLGFFELYNARTGAVDGGWQTDGSGEQTHWRSEPDQAWSASGYLRMIYSGLFGFAFGGDGLTFAPTLPPGWGPASLFGVPYRDATFDITLTGAGSRVTACTIDGRPIRRIDPTATGHHTVRIALEP